MYRRPAKRGLRTTSEIRCPIFGGNVYGRWFAPGIGKFAKRCLHKAERAYYRGHGRERSIKHIRSDINWKFT